MPIAVDAEPRIRRLEITDDAIVAHLADGRVISVPLSWSWRLTDASPDERSRFVLDADGAFVHWPELDEDLSARGMLFGTPAPRPNSSTEGRTARRGVRVARREDPAARRRGTRR
jgi:hypothetical protein